MVTKELMYDYRKKFKWYLISLSGKDSLKWKDNLIYIHKAEQENVSRK